MLYVTGGLGLRWYSGKPALLCLTQGQHLQDMVGTELANANDELQAQVAAAAAHEARFEAMRQTLLSTGLGFAAVMLDLKVCATCRTQTS